MVLDRQRKDAERGAVDGAGLGLAVLRGPPRALRILARQERILELELTTAVELSDEEAAKVVGQIEQAAGRKVEATRTVDPELIGGIVIQAGSQRLDASVRGRLDQLRQELTARS